MEKAPLSVTIITLNEEHNIARALQSVSWAEDIIIVDSGSSDRTIEIAEKLGARVFRRDWPGYGQQKNYAQTLARHDWVLSLDADEAVTPELAQEIQNYLKSTSLAYKGFSVPRKTWYLGRWILHGGWYPNALVRLVDRRNAAWTEPKVHESLKVEGPLTQLENPLLHYAFDGVQDQVLTNIKYSRFGYEELVRRGAKPSLFKLICKPIGKFIETYLIKRGFMDGVPGFIISLNAAHSIFMKYAYFFERTDRANSDHR